MTLLLHVIVSRAPINEVLMHVSHKLLPRPGSHQFDEIWAFGPRQEPLPQLQ